jgi:predicted acylesterase/phospholipase RssA
MTNPPINLGIVVSGGAPTIHLAAGALCAFSERGVGFKLIATAGAGALPALLFAAPRKRPGLNPQQAREAALKSVVNINVHDAIYQSLPNNYKVFHKYGPFSRFFWRLSQSLHKELDPDPHHNGPQRLFNDLVDLAFTAITPTTLRPRSKSVLTRVRVIDELVDWNGLKTSGVEFRLNAFDMRRAELMTFTQDTMGPEAFYAALAMPWLYPPTEVNGTTYTEGAAHDPSGLEATMKNGAPNTDLVHAIIIVDTIGPDVWIDPESMLESLALTIMDPLIALTEGVVTLYSVMEHVFNESPSPPLTLPKIYRLPFKIPAWECGRLWNWSYANALALWDAGYASTMEFCDKLSPQKEPDDEYRQVRALMPNPRCEDLLKLFGFQPHGGSPPPPGASALFS